MGEEGKLKDIRKENKKNILLPQVIRREPEIEDRQ